MRSDPGARRSLKRWLGACLAAVVVSAAVPSFASAELWIVYHWNLYETVTTYGDGGVSYEVTNDSKYYHWTVDTAHSTRVSYNWCSDYSYFEATDIPAHDQSIHYFTNDGFFLPGDCVRLRGRSLLTTQYNRNGLFDI